MNTRRSLLSFATAAIISPQALACSAAPESGNLRKKVLRAHGNASAVVLAKAIEAGFQDALAASFGEAPTQRAKLEVLENWKGRHQPGSVLQTTMSTRIGTCGMVVTPGEVYLLYLHDQEPYDLALSRRSARLVDASADIEILRIRFGKPSS